MHPADLDDLSAISRATHFIASIFVGRGVFAKTEPTSSLEVARHNAHALETTYRNGRGGMVYAVMPDGRSVLVPASYQPKEREMTDEIPSFLKRNAAAQPAAEKAKPAAKAAAPARPAKGGISRGVLTDKGKKSLAKPAKASKAAKAKAAKPKASKSANGSTRAPRGQRAAILEAAKAGTMPTPPDFSADTHKPHRKRLDEVVALAKAGDVKGLKAFKINPTSTSPKAIDRYRNLAVMALEARG